MIKRISLFTSIILLVMYTVSAQDKAQQIDRQIRAIAGQNFFTGAVLAATGGKVIFKKAYGAANREWNIPNTPATKFRIASVTKQFTAMLIMQLKQAGKLNLHAPVSAYLPWYRKDVGEKVTIHHLLTHTSGIPEFTQRPDFFSNISKHKFETKEFVEKYCSDTLETVPGTKFSYCNGGYYILGAIIEELTKKPYAQVLKEQILDVAGMKNTGVDDFTSIVQGRASGYTNEYGSYTNADYIDMASTVLSAGAMYSTVEDLYLWDRALYSQKLLSRENREIMMTPFLNDYAYGLVVVKNVVPGDKDSTTLVMHQGGINGFRAMFLRALEKEECIVLLANTTANEVESMSYQLLSILHGLPAPLPKPSLVNLMAQRIIKTNAAEGIAYYKQQKMLSKGVYDLENREQELNTLGYFLMRKKRLKEALAIFKLNMEEFPGSWNTYDSYAEALAADGQHNEAVQYYKKSVQMNPGNRHGIEELKKLEKTK